MSDEVSELRIENIALKEINKKLEGKISELEEKNHKMEEEIKALKAEKLQVYNFYEYKTKHFLSI